MDGSRYTLEDFVGFSGIFLGNIELPVVTELEGQSSVIRGFNNHHIGHKIGLEGERERERDRDRSIEEIKSKAKGNERDQSTDLINKDRRIESGNR